jgi:hypothetical protein
MLQTKDLLDHIDALVRLSYDAGDRAIAAKLRQLADEFRIMVSVADISDLAASLGKNPAPAAPAAPILAAPAAAVPVPDVPAPDVIGPDTGARKAPAVARAEVAVGPARVFHARYAGSNGTFACSRVGAP